MKMAPKPTGCLRRCFAPPTVQNPEEQKEKEDFIKKHLIQVSIEGISSRYTDDLSGFYRKIFEKDDKLNGMDVEEKEKVVKFVKNPGDMGDLPKKGWVVEIRGYTYHQNQWNFVEETFLENLNKPWYLEEKYRHIEDKPPDYSHHDRLKDKLTLDPKIHKQLLEKIRDRMSNVFIYQKETVENPEVGNFTIAGKSVLETVVDDGGGEHRRLGRVRDQDSRQCRRRRLRRASHPEKTPRRSSKFPT